MNKEEFVETKSEVERIIQEIKEAIVTLDNYKSFLAKTRSTERVIKAQIENLQREYNVFKNKLAEEIDKVRYKAAEDQGFVPKDAMELSKNINDTIREAYSWKLLEAQMFTIFLEKISSVLEDVKGLDIKKSVLDEMREMEKGRNNLFLETFKRHNQMVEEILNNKLRVVDEKFITSINLILKQSDVRQKNMLSSFGEIMTEAVKERKEFLTKYDAKEKFDITPDLKEIQKPIRKIDLANKQEENKKDDGKKVVKDIFGDADDDKDLIGDDFEEDLR
jgi:hypothetical protein